MTKRMQIGLVGLVAFLLGGLVAPQLPFAYGQDKSAKGPKWDHGLTLAARKHDEADFTNSTKKYGIEVFRDEANGNLIYITDTGSISVIKP